MNTQEQQHTIKNFKNTDYGIISCVYCLGEGWDFPLLDGVVFAENMRSNIRIVQSALRSCRKNKNQPNKISKIILPILNSDDWLDNNTDLKKVREIIYQMGLEDEKIIQKIQVYKVNIEKHDKKKETNNEITTNDELGEYDEEELKSKLLLKTRKRITLDISYEKAKKIIKEDYSIKSKKEYFEICSKDCRLSEEPDVVFNGQFTNWIDYLGIERIYYDLDTCMNKITVA
jgi:predicted helicase